MPHARLHVPAPIKGDSEIELDPERAHYLGRVLRMKPGSKLTVFDGCGYEYRAVVDSIWRDGAKLILAAELRRDVESRLKVRLVQGVSRGERMDLVMQKTTELGVAEIVPVTTERTVVRLNDARAERRALHWRKIVTSACEQCGRNVIPEVSVPTTLTRFLERDSDAAMRIVFLPGATHSLTTMAFTAGLVELLIGPEGGLSDQEIEVAMTAGYRGCTLGPRILRSETAGIAALAAMQALWGDLSD